MATIAHRRRSFRARCNNMKNCSCPGETAWTCVRSQYAPYSRVTHALITCHTKGLWCLLQNELNRKEHREGRKRRVPLKNKIREKSRQRASWDRKLRYETTYCWPCFNSSFLFSLQCSWIPVVSHYTQKQWGRGVLSLEMAEWPSGHRGIAGCKFTQPVKPL